jgi:predicted TIM-barrel fold metal-dependent hydrolase
MKDPGHDSGGWDCHAHLFGPYERFALAHERSYTPQEALEPQYIALLRRLGLAHGVLVHPSAYGDDHSLLLHALSAQPSLRGVAVVRPGSALPLAARASATAVGTVQTLPAAPRLPTCANLRRRSPMPACTRNSGLIAARSRRSLAKLSSFQCRW